ncbi:uncharacterized protein NMK_0047 [Novimethylophilus kurashikiensis]|uniref:Uncharacterized protein n=1 Tax=Novimethylophilus kurashikiensis TaxID=1825523 RepID=A0A2R5F199_9PROT|nr:AI-2E family transporter [Novimethylophilus kurashikiensis]GBG12516.1 uncharacterized protein NMK_0047 [Novimethylophilus kurashikiensis]
MNTQNKIQLASMAFIVTLLLGTLFLHLVPAAFIAMLVYLISTKLSGWLANHVREGRARLLAVSFIAFFIAGTFVVTGMLLGHFFGSHETVAGLAEKLGDILIDVRSKVPKPLLPYVPETLLDLKQNFAYALKVHGAELTAIGKEGLHALAHILIAIAIAAILTLHRFKDAENSKPLARAIRERLSLLAQVFENVVFAQARISAINTVLTGIYLLGVLPLSGVELPYAKTLVIATFFTGLIPIIGNLISNTLIVLVSLGLSFNVAVASLGFLVGVHKLEYFINARIVGGRVHAAAWELLLAMLVMETMFGVPGLLAAPIIYAYLKAELAQANLV